MTLTIDLVLLIVAFVCFVFAAIGVNPPRVGLVPLGLALWVLTAIVQVETLVVIVIILVVVLIVTGWKR